MMWKTHDKAKLKDQRSGSEDDLLADSRQILPSDVRITLLADRGFGDQAIYGSLLGAHVDFVVRFRDCIAITDAKGNTTNAAALVPNNGRGKKYSSVRVTHTTTLVPAVVCARAKNMEEACCLATSRDDLTASQIIALHGRRFTI